MSDIKNITVFSTSTCAYCPMVKKWLNIKGYQYDEVNLDQDATRQQEMIQKSGQMAVPVTIIEKDDGRESIVVGYNIGQLVSATAV